MQIFAKRRKTATGTATTPVGAVAQWKNKETASAKKDGTPTSASKNNNASDALVAELLKKDPSEWNSKEKRMVKRYQDRKKDEGEEELEQKGTGGNDINNNSSSSSPAPKPKKSKLVSVMYTREKVTAPEPELSDEDDEKEREEEPALDQEEEEEVQEEEQEEDTSEMAKVQKILDQLNAKQRRKLARRLEREGEACLAEVKAEAEQLLKEAAAETDDKNDNTPSSATASGKKRKRRRGSADESGLTPEERMRREEQRKAQQAAAERRASGEEAADFKHPLNSERRRANRRKPKWAPKKDFVSKKKTPDKIEHNASGFMVRKFKN